MTNRTHVREALAQLRRWMPIAGGVIALASVVQIFVFGFVHFTDIRYQQLRPISDDAPVVITRTAAVQAQERGQPFATEWELAQQRLAGTIEPTPDVNRVRSEASIVLERSSQTAVFLGVIGVVALVSMTALGAVIAGGGAIPGVERILGAAGGAMLLAIAAIPWNEAFPSVPITGVFTGFAEMTSSSDAARGVTSVSLVAMHVVVPIAVLAGSVFIVLRFNAGVEAGFLLDDAVDAEELLEQEIREINKRGPSQSHGTNVVKTLGQPQGPSATLSGPLAVTPISTKPTPPAAPPKNTPESAPTRRPL